MGGIAVLLVDDEERFLATTKLLLEKRGLEVVTAPNGSEAFAALDRHRIDVVVLDVKMPGMDGVEVLRKLKQRYPLIEVIMLTGHASVESAVEGLKLGAFDYVMKPCNIPEMLDKIKEAQSKKGAVEDKIRKAKVESIISHPLAVFDKRDE